MTDTDRLKLKNPRGWFAAGVEVQKALTVLSDGAFKLYMYICLHCRHDTGTLSSNPTEIARNLNKAPHSVRSYLSELQSMGICRVQPGRNRYVKGLITITDPYWPYQRSSNTSVQEGQQDYVSEVKKLMAARSCIRSSFSVADESLAQDWFQQTVALEQIEKAILLGCVRKYVSWRNSHAQTPITSLAYFQPVLDEIAQKQSAPEYWEYLHSRLQRMEKLWIAASTSRSVTHPQIDTAVDQTGDRSPSASGS